MLFHADYHGFARDVSFGKAWVIFLGCRIMGFELGEKVMVEYQ